MAYFLNAYYHTSFQDPLLSGASIAPSQVRAPAMLLLQIVRN
jgi:hypothetical protein